MRLVWFVSKLIGIDMSGWRKRQIEDLENFVPMFEGGERVFSKYEGVPLIGTVIRQVNAKSVMIHCDLPVNTKYVVHCEPNDIKLLKEM